MHCTFELVNDLKRLAKPQYPHTNLSTQHKLHENNVIIS